MKFCPLSIVLNDEKALDAPLEPKQAQTEDLTDDEEVVEL